MNVIILGGGRTGSLLATSLVRSKHSVTIIDHDAAAGALIEAALDGSGEITYVEGDGTRDATLERALIRDADLFVALTGAANVNCLAGLKAKTTYRVMTVIAAVWSRDLSCIFESLGVTCVNPARMLADDVIANISHVLQDQASAASGE
jgi:trk system potassium uptake protein TrkA